METFPRYWVFVRGIHQSPVNSQDKGQWPGALVFSLVCAWINGWVNNREAGDLRRRHRAHYDTTVMWFHVMTSRLLKAEATYKVLPVIKNVVPEADINGRAFKLSLSLIPASGTTLLISCQWYIVQGGNGSSEGKISCHFFIIMLFYISGTLISILISGSKEDGL